MELDFEDFTVLPGPEEPVKQDRYNGLKRPRPKSCLLERLREESTTPIERSESDSPESQIYADANDVELVKNSVIHQLNGDMHWLPSSSLGDKYQQLHTMFVNTIRDHEGHSVLIVGPRGSGKTAMVNRALAEVEAAFPEQFLVIRLNSFVHNDDSIGLREIARQLDRAFRKSGLAEDNERLFEVRSSNDTFANIMSTLESTNRQKMAMIFVIDEFDKFTSTSVRQTLLYNLFELSQTSGNPICIVGVSPRLTTRELLEKRVLSRFSQRVLNVTHANDRESFWQDIRPALTLRDEVISQLKNKVYGEIWNQWVDEAYKNNTTLTSVVFDVFCTTKSFQQVYHHCISAVSRITSSSPLPVEEDFLRLLLNNFPGSTTSQRIASLSPLELQLVISGARDAERRSSDGVTNLLSAYREYKDMINAQNLAAAVHGTSRLDSTLRAQFQVSQKVWPLELAKTCWANIYRRKLLDDVSGSGEASHQRGIRGSVVSDTKMVQLDVTLMELRNLIPDGSWERRFTML